MARGGRPAGACDVPLVRLFSGWADSPVWFDGPVAYEDTHLDGELVADLRAWDDGYYAVLTPTYAWSSPDLEARYLREAARLARRIADQIGDEFEVEHDLGATRRRVRASGPARNEEAAAAFRALAERSKAEWSTLQAAVERAKAEGHVLTWSAEPPPGSSASGTSG